VLSLSKPARRPADAHQGHGEQAGCALPSLMKLWLAEKLDEAEKQTAAAKRLATR
jgi:hypothetical protein